MKPWEAVAKKEHKEHIALMQEHLDKETREIQTLQERIAILVQNAENKTSGKEPVSTER